MIKLTKENLNEVKTGVVLVDFYAPYCSRCLQLLPFIEKLEPEFEGKVKFCKVDISEDDLGLNDVIENFSIFRALPHLKILKDGKEIKSFISNIKPKDVEEELKTLG